MTINSDRAITGWNIGDIPTTMGYPSPVPAKIFPIAVKPESGSTFGVGLCRYGNTFFTIFPDSGLLNQNCHYIIDQVVAV